jgi:hypothetical protein
MKKLALFLILVLVTGCAGTQVDTKDVVNSLAEKAGIACYAYLPEHRDLIEQVCVVMTILDETDPVLAQEKIKEVIGNLWIAADECGMWLVQTTLNDFVRFSGLNTESPTTEKVKEWLSFLDAFCAGAEMAKKMKTEELTDFFDDSTRLCKLTEWQSQSCGLSNHNIR